MTTGSLRYSVETLCTHSASSPRRAPSGAPWRHREDALDIGREAPVEHLVGLVEHEVGDAVEPHRPAVEVVEDAARRADDDLRPGVDRILLRAEGAAAVDQRRCGCRRGLASASSTSPTCWASSRVGTSTSAWSHLLSRVDLLDQRQAEGERLAGAGEGLADDVASFEEMGDGCCLDGGGFFDFHRS